MTDTMRGFMPTIKCSMCAQEIEISMMGEHICAPQHVSQQPQPYSQSAPQHASPAYQQEPQYTHNASHQQDTQHSHCSEPGPLQNSQGPPYPSQNAAQNSQYASQLTQSPPSSFQRPAYQRTQSNGDLLKPGRLPPPRVDISAANRPFARQDTLTPMSSSTFSGAASPRTPGDMPRSPFLRKQSLPSRMQDLPSPEILSSNLDNAFPPFPTKKPPPPSLKNTNFAKDLYTEADPMFAPKSPALQGTGHLLQRMNSIAPGPFDPKQKGQFPTRGDSAKSRTAPSITELPRTETPTLPDLAHTIPKIERTNGYAGFGPPETLSRAQTFPTQSTRVEEESLARRPSEPVRKTPTSDNKGFDFGLGRRSPGSRDGARQDSIAEDYEVGNPYHTPNLSQSSNTSEQSGVSGVSSRSSPPSDYGRGRTEKDLKNMPAQRVQTSPVKQPNEQWARGIEPPTFNLSAPESPMDPAIQGGFLQPVALRPAPVKAASAPAVSNPGPATPRPVASASPPASRPTTPSVSAPRAVPSALLAQSARTAPLAPPRRPSTAKGTCKGCNELIKGKSVSSADGRLTGRYHKACFVCKTCSEPFATASFYVLNDAPYCERHYHQLNNSMCKSCDRGIEGQYIQTERGTRHHPHCLSCSDCKTILKEDYFEMNGRIYCERDAMRRATQRNMGGLGVPGQTNRMERRTTRLMMI